MSDQPTSLLAGRVERLHTALLISVCAHATILAIALVATRAGADTSISKLDEPPIVAKLVRLGEERDPNLLPRKQASPPPPPPRQASTPSPPPAEPEPEPAAPAAPSKKAPSEPSREESRPSERPATPERSEPDLDGAIERFLGSDPDARPDDGPIFGSPDGDPYGDAAVATEGDRYLALVTRRLRENYRVPSIIGERDRLHLNATIVIYVGHDGRILRQEIERPSGNRHFDAALQAAVNASDPLPPPPPGWAERFRREGLGVNFRL